MHDLKVKAVRIKQNHILQKIFTQLDEFNKVLEAFNDNEEIDFLKQLVIEHKLLSNFNKNLPHFYTPSQDVQILMVTNTPCHIVFNTIIKRLIELNCIVEYFYTTKELIVITWSEDYPKLSKNLKSKLRKPTVQ